MNLHWSVLKQAGKKAHCPSAAPQTSASATDLDSAGQRDVDTLASLGALPSVKNPLPPCSQVDRWTQPAGHSPLDTARWTQPAGHSPLDTTNRIRSMSSCRGSRTVTEQPLDERREQVSQFGQSIRFRLLNAGKQI
jgi:hypothetical protein